MADLIDRNFILSEIEEEIEASHEYPEDELINKGLRIARKRVLLAPSVNNWIPCIEKLPEQGQRVIVQFRYNCAKNYTAISSARRTCSGEWIVDVMRYADKECITVQAWMPMPEEYKQPESEVT
jgi:hypothetical protein